jgi:hypothetical protein
MACHLSSGPAGWFVFMMVIRGRCILDRTLRTGRVALGGCFAYEERVCGRLAETVAADRVAMEDSVAFGG